MVQTPLQIAIKKININDKTELEKLYDFVNQIYSEEELKLKRTDHFPEEFLEGIYCIEDSNQDIKGYFALYQNLNLIYQGRKTLCIGNYECINDLKNDYCISSQIINFCKEKTTELKAEFLIAPMNGSTWNEYRFLNLDKKMTVQENLKHAFFLEPIHKNYYNNQFLKADFEPISTYFSLLDTQMNYGNNEVLRQKERLKNENIKIRKIDLENFEKELEQLFPFVNSLFKQNFLYTPVSLDSFKEKYLPIQSLINPNYVLIAEHRINNENKTVGFIFCYSNFYSKNEKQLVCKTIGRNQDDFYKGLGHVMTYLVSEKAKKDGFSAFIHAFMIENSLSSELSRNFAKQKYRTYTLYGMEI